MCIEPVVKAGSFAEHCKEANAVWKPYQILERCVTVKVSYMNRLYSFGRYSNVGNNCYRTGFRNSRTPFHGNNADLYCKSNVGFFSFSTSCLFYLFFFPQFISLPLRYNPQSVHKAITRFTPLLSSDWRLAYLRVRRLLSFAGHKASQPALPKLLLKTWLFHCLLYQIFM